MSIARFEKVSYKQFARDLIKYLPSYQRMDLNKVYNNIQLPKRATHGSAGYDFYWPYKRNTISAGSCILIPTGIKCNIENGWCLVLLPKSGLGTKHRVSLENTIGLVDSDYYNCETTEGHIYVKLSNDDRDGRSICFDEGVSFCQGVFLPYGLAEDEVMSENIRTGAFGSTGK